MGERPAWIGRWETAIVGKQLDSVRKETHVVSDMIQRLETASVSEKKGSRSLLHQKRRHRLTVGYPLKVQAAKVKVLLEQEARFRAEMSLCESVGIRQ